METPGHPDTFLGATGHPDTCVRVSGCPNVQVSGWILLGRVSIFLPWSLRVGGGVHVSMCPCVSRRHFKVSTCHCVRIAFFIFTVRSPCRTMSVWLCVPVTHDYYVHIPLLALLERNRDPMAAREYLSMLVLRHPLLFVGSGHRGDTRSNI